MLPLIGITGRTLAFGSIDRADPRFVGEHVNLFFSAFARRVAEAGGIPVELPFEAATVGVMDRLDALIITGGQDIHPTLWTETAAEDTGVDPRVDYNAPDSERDAYEANLLRAAIDLDRAVLCVCRGMQLLNVVHGGTLIEDITGTPITHYSPEAAPSPGPEDHTLITVPGSLVHSLYGAASRVNSWHHQALDTIGGGLLATGATRDGIVEAVELPGASVVGVQWHPEWTPTLDPIFGWLVNAAKPTPELTDQRKVVLR